MTSGCHTTQSRRSNPSSGGHHLQRLWVIVVVVINNIVAVDGFRIGRVPVLQHPQAQQHELWKRRRTSTSSTYRYSHSNTDSDNYSVGGGGQEGFHYLSTDVPPDFRNSLQGDGPDGDRVRSTASFTGQGERRLEFLYNNHSEAEQIRAAHERRVQPMLDAAAIAKLTPPLLGPPAEEEEAAQQQQYALPAEAQEQQQESVPAQEEYAAAALDPPSTAPEPAYREQQQQQQWQQTPADQAAAAAVEQPASAGDMAGSAAASVTNNNNEDDSLQPPLSSRLSWTPTSTLHEKPLWYDLQSEPQRNSQLQAELRRAYQELQHYHTLLLDYEHALDAAASHQTATDQELAASHADTAAAQATIAQLRNELQTLQQQVQEGKAVELEYVKREVAYLQQQGGATTALATPSTAAAAAAALDSTTRELAHAKEQHQRELEVVRQQGYQSAVNKVHNWGQRITKLENELKQLQTMMGGRGVAGGAATAHQQPQTGLPQLQASQASQRPWSTMPGATFFGTDGVVYDSAYDTTRTTD